MTSLVTGPFRLTERKLIVQSPMLAVIFRNGKPYGVRGAGRHGAVVGGLPPFGELSYLLFDPAPFRSAVQCDDIRLADGGRVSVIADLMVQPTWATSDESLLAIAAVYGTEAHRYAEAASVELQAAFKAEARRGLSKLDHRAVVGVPDARELVDTGRVRGTLISVQRVLELHVVRDPHFDQIDDAFRAADVGRAQMEAEGLLQPLRFTLDAARMQFELAGETRRRLSVAESDLLVADMYGVLPWAVAYPEQEGALRVVREQFLGSLLTEYSDVIPYMADQMGVSPRDLLMILSAGGPSASPSQRSGGAGPGPSVGSGWNVDPLLAEMQEGFSELRGLTAGGVGGAKGVDGTVEVLIAATVRDPGQAGVLELTGDAWRDRGVNRALLVCVAHSESVEELAVGLLQAILPGLGVTGATINVVIGGSNQCVLDVIIQGIDPSADADAVADRLAGWTSAIQSMSQPRPVDIRFNGGP